MPTSPTAAATLAEYKTAERQLTMREARTGIQAHATVYAVVMTVMIVANLIFLPQFYFFVFPLLSWGFGLLMHYTFGYRKAAE
jgi:hypothetical protein